MSSWNILTQDEESQGSTIIRTFTVVTKLVSLVPYRPNGIFKSRQLFNQRAREFLLLPWSLAPYILPFFNKLCLTVNCNIYIWKKSEAGYLVLSS